jgi:hypothetical protein
LIAEEHIGWMSMSKTKDTGDETKDEGGGTRTSGSTAVQPAAALKLYERTCCWHKSNKYICSVCILYSGFVCRVKVISVTFFGKKNLTDLISMLFITAVYLF